MKQPEPTGFADFWDLWRPHKRHTDGRGDARDCFIKHIKNGVEPQDIVDGARWFLRNMKDRDREYIPLAATWLNRRDYEDGCESERAFRQRAEATKAAPAGQPVKPHIPDSHFSRRFERGEFQIEVNSNGLH